MGEDWVALELEPDAGRFGAIDFLILINRKSKKTFSVPRAIEAERTG
jgi:hypothetical protein